MSKGSAQRPTQVPDKQVRDNWDRIFNKPKKDSKKDKE